MEKTTFIYILTNPETGDIRYVGKTHYLKQRLYSHIRESKSHRKSHKISWIKSLLNQGLRPKIEVIDEVPENEWKFWEKYWIDQFKQWGFKLTNLTEGGQGGVGYKHSEESKRKMSESHSGKVLSEEHKKSISESIKNKASENPYYNRGEGNSKIILDREELYQKYITENLSTNGCAKYFGVGNKKIWSALQEYNIKKDKESWREQLVTNPKKIVLQYDKDGNFIKEWIGLKSIENELGFNSTNIANCCRGVIKSSRGYVWKYK